MKVKVYILYPPDGGCRDADIVGVSSVDLFEPMIETEPVGGNICPWVRKVCAKEKKRITVRIRAKIVFVVVPILMTSLVITGVVSSFSARSGMTRIAMEFLGFKADELENYAYSQWNLLVQNGLQEEPRYIEVAQDAVASYAGSIIRSDTEIILALDQDARVAMATGDVELTVVEKARLYRSIHQKKQGWTSLTIGDVQRVGQTFYFDPFG